MQAGDYVIQRPQSWFVNYFKKIKGLGVKTAQHFGKTAHESEVNIASSRGKFARQTLAVTEGNQGPYKLTGNNNERFLIVLSGTEKSTSTVNCSPADRIETISLITIWHKSPSPQPPGGQRIEGNC